MELIDKDSQPFNAINLLTCSSSIIYDENAKLIEDPDHSEDEERFILLGLSHSLRVILVCHCHRSEGNVIRIISARKATPNESKVY